VISLSAFFQEVSRPAAEAEKSERSDARAGSADFGSG
jgi:hypothetical protein